jgi:alpha-glucoside transport system substrate-binding protein
MAEIWFDDTYVYSGTASIAYTFFGDSPAPLFENPPGCWFHKLGPLITGFFPEQAQPGLDYGVFLLPEIVPTYGQPMLITGDIMAVFNDRPEVRALMEYFTTPNSVAGWLVSGGALAAHQTAIPEMYANDLDAMIARLIPQVSGFYYDASDQMPPEVGAGTFWQAMTDWVSGHVDIDTALVEIDNSWP